MYECMLDLETLAVTYDAVILSIGAVQFDLERPDLKGARFYQNVDPESCVAAGLKVDPGTIAWWGQQDAKAREGLLINQVQLKEACEKLRDWMKLHKIGKVWGNGATFDCVIVRTAFDAVKVDYPIHFSNDRDVRTIMDVARRLIGKPLEKVKRAGVNHNALDDALYQVQYVSDAYRRLK